MREVDAIEKKIAHCQINVTNRKRRSQNWGGQWRGKKAGCWGEGRWEYCSLVGGRGMREGGRRRQNRDEVMHRVFVLVHNFTGVGWGGGKFFFLTSLSFFLSFMISLELDHRFFFPFFFFFFFFLFFLSFSSSSRSRRAQRSNSSTKGMINLLLSVSSTLLAWQSICLALCLRLSSHQCNQHVSHHRHSMVLCFDPSSYRSKQANVKTA